MITRSLVRSSVVSIVVAACWLPACSSSDSSPPPVSPAGGDAGLEASEADEWTPADGAQDVVVDAAQEEADATVLQEKEPNNGSTDTEYNALPLGAIMQGAVGETGDSDIFRVDTAPGKAYTVTLGLPSGTQLQGHLTVMDTGRDGNAAGEDYVKIVKTSSGDVRLDLLAMGQGGTFVVVRDSRNISSATVGGPGYTYTVTVAEVDPKTFEAPALQFPVNQQDKLERAGGLRLYPFTATPGANAMFDLQATGTMDGRLMVFASSTGSWIARNDDRAMSDPNPLIDAPLSESGAMWLVVENVDETATDWAYSLQGSLQ